MGNCNAAAVGMEMPGYAATDLKGGPAVGTVKGGRNAAQAVISDFKKKLDSLSAAGQPAAVQMPDAPPEDLSMATSAAAQELPQAGVGILEGFGLLDGQTDMSAASADAAQKTAVSAQTPSAAEAQQAQTSGQFARMLHHEQPGGTAADMPQQPNAGAGEYSGSLESTNSIAAGAEAARSGDGTAMQQLKSKLAASSTAPSEAQAAQTDMTADAVQPMTQRVAGVVQPTADAVQPTADAAQPAAEGAQLTAEGTQAAAGRVAPAESQLAAADTQRSADDDTQDHPAAKAAPPAMTAMDTEGATARALQTDTAVKAETMPGTTAQPAESAFVKDNVIRIVDKASAHIREGKYEFDVDLKPDFLGKVSIRLTMQGGEVRMHVRADDPAVRGMFSDQTNALASALKEKGIALATVDVSYQDPMAAGREAFAQSGNDGGGQRREEQIGWTADRYGSEAFETLTPVAELRGGSSVEYLA